MIKGVIGAVIAGAIGAAIWTAVAYFTGYEVGWIAWILGGLVGLGMALGAQDDADTPTGVVAALIAVGALAAGKFGAVHFIVDKELAKIVASQGPVTMDDAKIIMADQLVDEYQRAGKTLTWPEGMSMEVAGTITDYPADLQKDLETRWAQTPPETQEAYRTTFEANVAHNVAAEAARVKPDVFKKSFGLFDLLFIGLAIATAFKVGSGLSGD